MASHIIVDTGCSDHILNQRSLFRNLRTANEKSVRDPKGNLTAVEEIGDVPITVQLKDGKMAELTLRNVLYVPNYKVNLLSVNKAIKFGHRFIFNDSKARMVLSDVREINLRKDTGLFFLEVTYQNLSTHPPAVKPNKASKEISIYGTNVSGISTKPM